jgi:hypothetical protein
MTLDRALTWFIGIWIGLVFILTMTSFAATMLAAPTVWDGLAKIRDELHPSNYRLYVTVFLLLSPAILAMGWRDRRRRRAKNSNSADTQERPGA